MRRQGRRREALALRLLFEPRPRAVLLSDSAAYRSTHPRSDSEIPLAVNLSVGEVARPCEDARAA